MNSAGAETSQQDQHIREISGTGPIQIGLGAIPIAEHKQQVVEPDGRIVVEVPGQGGAQDTSPHDVASPPNTPPVCSHKEASRMTQDDPIQHAPVNSGQAAAGTLHRGALEHSATEGTILKRGAGARGIGEATSPGSNASRRC